MILGLCDFLYKCLNCLRAIFMYLRNNVIFFHENTYTYYLYPRYLLKLTFYNYTFSFKCKCVIPRSILSNNYTHNTYILTVPT